MDKDKNLNELKPKHGENTLAYIKRMGKTKEEMEELSITISLALLDKLDDNPFLVLGILESTLHASHKALDKMGLGMTILDEKDPLTTVLNKLKDMPELQGMDIRGARISKDETLPKSLQGLMELSNDKEPTKH